MQTAIKTHAPDMVYIIIPLILAIIAVIINFLGSPESAVGVALLAYSTSALGSILKMDLSMR
jgi:hypothetical protein